MKVISMHTVYTQEATTIHPNCTEFGYASEASALIQRALYSSFGTTCHTINRAALTKKLLSIIKTDKEHAWGERTLDAANIRLLEGCELGKRKPTHLVTYLQPQGNINSRSGYCEISLPAFTPAEVVRMQHNVSHMQLFACAMSLNFERMEVETDIASTDYLSLAGKQEAETLSLMVNASHGQPIVLFFGVGLYFNVNGNYYLSLTNGGISIKCLKAVKAGSAA